MRMKNLLLLIDGMLRAPMTMNLSKSVWTLELWTLKRHGGGQIFGGRDLYYLFENKYVICHLIVQKDHVIEIFAYDN